jgi:hypothetical protein
MIADSHAEGPPGVSRICGGEEKRLVCHRVMRSERNGEL